MINFGYTINKDKSLNFDEVDHSLAMFLSEQEPSFDTCISCGSCAGTCTASNFTAFNLRKINLLVIRGDVQAVSEEIEKCMLCGKCTLACPRNVNTRNVVLQIRRFFSESQPDLPVKKQLSFYV
jgi:heterodisulfide reductase subunit C